MSEFKLVSDFSPKGDQPKAIEALTRGIRSGKKHQVLLGVTGSGKTFTMAHVLAAVQKPTLVLAPNKTLAAQLYNEFKQLFPEYGRNFHVIPVPVLPEIRAITGEKFISTIAGKGNRYIFPGFPRYDKGRNRR